MSIDTREWDDLIGEKDKRIAELEAALNFAGDEIRWWATEHGCCAGHESEALAKIDSVLNP